LIAASGAALLTYLNGWGHKADCEEAQPKIWPVYRKRDLQKHKRLEDRIWVAFRDGVYDITDFIKVHPGGSEKILLGAGNNLEPFFAFYPFHVKDHVLSILGKYKIGELHPEDRVKEESIPKFDSTSGDSAFDQGKSKNLKILQAFPLIAETDSKVLVSSFITPNSEFFVRGHQHIPDRVDKDTF